MGLFGSSAPKIVCTSPSVTVDLSTSSNHSVTERNYDLSDVIIHTSPLTGHRSIIYNGSYGGWRVKIWNLSANDWNNTYKQLRGVTVTFYPHADELSESCSAYVIDAHPYHRDNHVELDAVILDIISVDYYSPTEH